MCIILHTTKKLGLPTEDRLKDNFRFNPDGAGYAIVYTKKGKKKIEYQKGFDKFDTYNHAVTKAFSKLKEDDDYIILHMRIATSGGKALDKTHPFRTKDGTLIFQNGICPASVTKHLKKNESDTEWIAKNYVDADWVKKCDGSSRWVIIKPDGTLIKHGTWVSDSGGRSWSNGTYSGYTYPGYGYGRRYGYYDDYYDTSETYVFERDVLRFVNYRAYNLLEVLKRDFKATYMESLKAVIINNYYFYLDKSFGVDVWDNVRVIGSLSPHTFDRAVFIVKDDLVIHVRDEQYDNHENTVYLSNALHFVEYLLSKANYKNLVSPMSGDMKINYLGNDWGVTCNSKDADTIVEVLNAYFTDHRKPKIAIKYKKSINIENKAIMSPSTYITLDKKTLDTLNKDMNSWLRQLESMDKIDITYGYVHERTMKLHLTARLIGETQKYKYYRPVVISITSVDVDKLFGLEQEDLFMEIYTNTYEGE